MSSFVARMTRASAARVLTSRLLGAVFLALVFSATALGQATAVSKGIDDVWQGTLHGPNRELRSVLKISKNADGTLKGLFYSLDQGGQPIPIKETTFQGGELRLNIDAVDGTYVGKMSADGATISGEWKQSNGPLPLILLRATPDTAWAIPEPPPKIPAMAANVNLGYDVATIKPSDPKAQGKGFGGRPPNFRTGNTTLYDLLGFAYNLHPKQVLGGPGWSDTDKFDIVLKLDTPGQPNEEQLRGMMKKLLVDRFSLKFHGEKRELPAYVLSVAKGGPKLAKSESDPHTPSSFFFRQLGNLTIVNQTMDDFSHWMQTVLDRPVVNHTSLEGRFDAKLKWNPDETQFASFGVKVTPSDAPDAPPDLYRAIQEQVGLKLDATKTMAPVLVVDHVEKPGDN